MWAAGWAGVMFFGWCGGHCRTQHPRLPQLASGGMQQHMLVAQELLRQARVSSPAASAGTPRLSGC